MKKEDRKEKDLGFIATRIAEERKAKGYTQQQLAQMTGMTTQKINYIELNIKR